MKRLVICCDGTWNRSDNDNVTNIEKIARTIQTDLTRTGGVQQLVLYISGVGAGSYKVDRWLGGAFGFGLFSNVRTAYRFLALNYEPGDEIFVFGFSRGAYTARSLVGMVARVGLLTRTALVADKLPEAVNRYRRTSPRGRAFGESDAEFKHDHCHPDTPVAFLGVFDTVGALGVPGAVRRGHQFHDIKLSRAVLCARQALAIDEHRMTFEPCLWQVDAESADPPDRVKQVWFEGVHSDVGGGYPETGLSDTTLLWMAGEANRQGLVFDEELLGTYVASGKSAVRHSSMNLLYRTLNLKRLVVARFGRKNPAFEGSFRQLSTPTCNGVLVAASAAAHYRDGEDYRPTNLALLSKQTNEFEGVREPVIALPEPSIAVVHQLLARQGVDLGSAKEEVGRVPTPGLVS